MCNINCDDESLIETKDHKSFPSLQMPFLRFVHHQDVAKVEAEKKLRDLMTGAVDMLQRSKARDGPSPPRPRRQGPPVASKETNEAGERLVYITPDFLQDWQQCITKKSLVWSGRCIMF